MQLYFAIIRQSSLDSLILESIPKHEFAILPGLVMILPVSTDYIYAYDLGLQDYCNGSWSTPVKQPWHIRVSITCVINNDGRKTKQACRLYLNALSNHYHHTKYSHGATCILVVYNLLPSDFLPAACVVLWASLRLYPAAAPPALPHPPAGNRACQVPRGRYEVKPGNYGFAAIWDC